MQAFSQLRHLLHKIAVIQISILFFILYILIIVPFGVLKRLGQARHTKTTWEKSQSQRMTIAELKKM